MTTNTRLLRPSARIARMGAAFCLFATPIHASVAAETPSAPFRAGDSLLQEFQLQGEIAISGAGTNAPASPVLFEANTITRRKVLSVDAGGTAMIEMTPLGGAMDVKAADRWIRLAIHQGHAVAFVNGEEVQDEGPAEPVKKLLYRQSSRGEMAVVEGGSFAELLMSPPFAQGRTVLPNASWPEGVEWTLREKIPWPIPAAGQGDAPPEWETETVSKLVARESAEGRVVDVIETRSTGRMDAAGGAYSVLGTSRYDQASGEALESKGSVEMEAGAALLGGLLPGVEAPARIKLTMTISQAVTTVEEIRAAVAQEEAARRAAAAKAPTAPAAAQPAPPGAAAAAAADPDKLLALGRSYYETGRFSNGRETEKAVELLTQVLAMQPGNTAAMGLLGACRYAMGDVDGALAFFRRELESNPPPPRARFLQCMIADLLLARGDTDAAVSLLTEVQQASPDHPEAHSLMGIYYWQAGASADRDKEFKRAASLSPVIGKVHYNRAKELEWKKQYARALPHYVAASILDPSDASACFWAAACFAASDRKEEAVQYYEQFLARDRGNTDTTWSDRARAEIESLRVR